VDLEQRFQIFAPDQRGHGSSQLTSPEAESFHPQDYAQDLWETLHDTLKTRPRFGVVGHSMGVRSALYFALLALKQGLPPSGVVCIDLGLRGLVGGGLGTALEQYLSQLPETYPSREAAKSVLFKNCPDPSMAQYLMAVLRTTPDGVSLPFQKEALLRTLRDARGVELHEVVGQLLLKKIPLLMIRGETSRVWSQEEFNRESKKFPDAQWITIAGAGHGVPFEKRKESSEIIRSFFSERILSMPLT
jgi:pimeloyl-ACP methyl ester carboxylesterase